MRLEWDESKNHANREKHGVSFEEAGAIFTTGLEYLDIFDEAHSNEEDRFIAIGPMARGIVLVVYTEPEGDTIRIISARLATKVEAERYREYSRGRER